MYACSLGAIGALSPRSPEGLEDAASEPRYPPHDFADLVSSIINICRDTGLPIVLEALLQQASNRCLSMLLTATDRWPPEKGYNLAAWPPSAPYHQSRPRDWGCCPHSLGATCRHRKPNGFNQETVPCHAGLQKVPRSMYTTNLQPWLLHVAQ